MIIKYELEYRKIIIIKMKFDQVIRNQKEIKRMKLKCFIIQYYADFLY